jgi:diguanylate cyclase (GGDEF)-like protein
MDPAQLSSPDARAELVMDDERQTMGRIAAAIWAAIAFFGALATVKPLRFPETDVSAMRLVVLSAAIIAAVAFVLPWKRLPKGFLTGMLVLMSLHISALAYASGAVQSDVTMLFTFVIALAACFLPVRTSVAQVGLIAILLTTGLLLLDKENAGAEALRATLLLAVLVVLCGLVLILRAVIAERAAQLRMQGHGWHAYQAGLLDDKQLDKLLERELSRAGRHARPLSVVMLSVSGRVEDGAEGSRGDRLVTILARSILGRVRVEDAAAHLGGLRFAIVAPETSAAGAASIAETVTDVVRRRLVTLGYDSASFEITVGWADFPHHAQTRGELLKAASSNLQAAVVRHETARSRAEQESPAPGARPSAAGQG